MAHAIGGKTTIVEALPRRPFQVNPQERTQYRLEIPVVSRAPRADSTVVPQAHSPTYSAGLDLETVPLPEGSDALPSSPVRENTDKFWIDGATGYSSSSTSLGSRFSRDSLTRSNLSKQLTVVPVNHQEIPPISLNSAVIQFIPTQQDEISKVRKTSIGQAIEEVIISEPKFSAIRDRLLVHRDVFSELAMFSAEDIKNWIVENTNCSHITALSCAKAILAVFQ